MGHTFSRILLYVIFSTKERLSSLYRDMRGDLLGYIQGIARNEGDRGSRTGKWRENVLL